MAHNIQIKGTADFSAINREVKKLAGTINESVDKNGMKLIDQQSAKFLKTEAVKQINQMRQSVRALAQEAKKLDDALAAGNLSEEKRNEILKQRLDLVKKISSGTKNINDLNDKGKRLDNVIPVDFKAGRKLMGRSADFAEGLPGVGKPFGVVRSAWQAGSSAFNKGGFAGGAAGAEGAGAAGTGMGMAGMAAVGVGLAALTAVVGGTILAFSKMSDAFDYFSQSIPSIIARSGMGVGDFSSRQRATAMSLGYSPEELIQSQIGSARAFGTQRSGRGNENLVMNSMTAARSLGMGTDEIFGTANSMRSTMGVRQSESAMGQILGRALTQGMDKSQATHFLSATADLLTDINKSGMMSNDALIGAMASLTKNNAMSPEQAAKTISGMQSAITGSTGESNVFFQRALSTQGIGGGSLLGAQYGVSQGLTGINSGEFLKQSGGNKQALSDLKSLGLVDQGDYQQRVAKGILGQVDQQGFNQDTIEGRTGKASFIGNMFGAQNIGESYKIQSVLQKMAEGTSLSKEDQKVMQDLSKDPEQRWRDESLKALNTIAGGVARTKAGEGFAKFDLGKNSSDVFNKLTEVNIALIQSIDGLKTAISGEAGTSDTGMMGSAWDGIKSGFNQMVNPFGAMADSAKQKSIKEMEVQKAMADKAAKDPINQAISFSPEAMEHLKTISTGIQKQNNLMDANSKKAVPPKVNRTK